MTTLQVRIDEKTKRDAKRVLDRLGLDMSGAVKLYLRQISLRKRIPMELYTENGLTPDQETEIIQASDDARRGMNVTKPMSAREAISYLTSAT